MSKPVFLVYIDAKLLHLTYVIIQYKKYIIRKWISSRKATDSIPKKKKNPQKHKKNTISLERNLFKKRESKGIAVEIRTEGRQLPLLDEGALSLTRG